MQRSVLYCLTSAIKLDRDHNQVSEWCHEHVDITAKGKAEEHTFTTRHHCPSV